MNEGQKDVWEAARREGGGWGLGQERKAWGQSGPGDLSAQTWAAGSIWKWEGGEWRSGTLSGAQTPTASVCSQTLAPCGPTTRPQRAMRSPLTLAGGCRRHLWGLQVPGCLRGLQRRGAGEGWPGTQEEQRLTAEGREPSGRWVYGWPLPEVKELTRFRNLALNRRKVLHNCLALVVSVGCRCWV